MKKTLICSFVLSSAFFASAANANFGGRISFEGEVVNGTCAVDANSVDQIVRLGQVRSSAFTAAGQVAGSVPFSIQLNDCDTTSANNAMVGFIGTANSIDANALAVTGGAGAATGIGIYITDSSSTVVTPDGTQSTPVSLQNGKNVLPFNARYVSVANAVTPGTANATTTFHITYN